MDILNQYLFQHKRISIPGLGTLHMERVPAQTDFVNHQILPPAYAFRFDQYFDAPDKEFFAYLANHKHLPDYEAIRWYNEYSYDLRARLRNQEPAEWEGLGHFMVDEKGEIHFEADHALTPRLKPIKAERILRTDARHQLLVGDSERSSGEMPELLSDTHVEKESWWIYALIIAALALCILCYQLFSNDMRFSSLINQQTIPVQEMPATTR